MKHKFKALTGSFAALLFSHAVFAAELQIQKVQFEAETSSQSSSGKAMRRTSPTGAELVRFTTDAPATPKVFALENPARVVIDLPTFRWKVPAAELQAYKGQLLRQVRYARHSESTSRIVLDLNQNITQQLISGPESTEHVIRLAPVGAWVAAPANAPAQEQPRLRNNENVKTKEGTLGRIEQDESDEGDAAAQAKSANHYPIPQLKPGQERNNAPTMQASKKIVVIDAGHGGQDPGAIGQGGTKEKLITLDYAQALKAKLESTGRYKAVLTRDKDFFIPLRQRVQLARQAKGNLFISLHADSAPGSDARGLSVYSLSETASDAEAAKLAAKENKADIINGVDLSGASKDVADILIDLTQRSTMARSESFGASILHGVRQANVVTLSKPHRHAGFAVLKAPDIPSVLVELGFLSNGTEERLLQTAPHRAQIIDGLVKGIDSYFAKTTTNP